MACTRHLWAYRPKEGSRSRQLVWNSRNSDGTAAIPVPCGQCIGCRLEKSRQWAMRCEHERQMHSQNCCITLTYTDDTIPAGKGVDLRDPVLFMKKLRKAYTGKTIRTYGCAEYGEQMGRPHYHILIFGLDFEDKQLQRSSEGMNYYTSDILERIWGKGDEAKFGRKATEIMDLNFHTAAYVARYCTKILTVSKRTPPEIKAKADAKYTDKPREQAICISRRPGIGKEWFEKYTSDVYPHNEVIIKGHKMKPPIAYARWFEKLFPDEMEQIKLTSTKKNFANKIKIRQELDNLQRMLTLEECMEAKIKQKNRKYESNGN